MQKNKGSIGDLGLLILFLVILFFLWLFLGGKNHPAATSSPYINPLNDSYNPSPIK